MYCKNEDREEEDRARGDYDDTRNMKSSRWNRYLESNKIKGDQWTYITMVEGKKDKNRKPDTEVQDSHALSLRPPCGTTYGIGHDSGPLTWCTRATLLFFLGGSWIVSRSLVPDTCPAKELPP